MPRVSVIIMGKQFPCTCKCGEEVIPVTFVPGEINVACTKYRMMNRIRMYIDEFGIPKWEVS